MKQNLTYEVTKSTCYTNEGGMMQWKEEFVVFRKEIKSKEEGTGEVEKKTIEHHARIVTHINEKKKGNGKLIRLLTNDLDAEYEDIVAIYKTRWSIESLFKQIKQNFLPSPLQSSSKLGSALGLQKVQHFWPFVCILLFFIQSHCPNCALAQRRNLLDEISKIARKQFLEVTITNTRYWWFTSQALAHSSGNP